MGRMPPILAKALRYNDGKAPLHWILTAPHGVEAVCRVYEFGARKYAPDNWKKGLDTDEIIDSLLRHLSAFKAGETLDPESGLPTLAHAAWNALVLCDQTIRNAETLANSNVNCYCSREHSNCNGEAHETDDVEVSGRPDPAQEGVGELGGNLREVEGVGGDDGSGWDSSREGYWKVEYRCP